MLRLGIGTSLAVAMLVATALSGQDRAQDGTAPPEAKEAARPDASAPDIAAVAVLQNGQKLEIAGTDAITVELPIDLALSDGSVAEAFIPVSAGDARWKREGLVTRLAFDVAEELARTNALPAEKLGAITAGTARYREKDIDRLPRKFSLVTAVASIRVHDPRTGTYTAQMAVMAYPADAELVVTGPNVNINVARRVYLPGSYTFLYPLKPGPGTVVGTLSMYPYEGRTDGLAAGSSPVDLSGISKVRRPNVVPAVGPRTSRPDSGSPATHPTTFPTRPRPTTGALSYDPLVRVATAESPETSNPDAPRTPEPIDPLARELIVVRDPPRVGSLDPLVTVTPESSRPDLPRNTAVDFDPCALGTDLVMPGEHFWSYRSGVWRFAAPCDKPLQYYYGSVPGTGLPGAWTKRKGPCD